MGSVIDTLAHLADPAYWFAFLLGLAIATVISLVPGVGSTLMLGIALPLVVLGIPEPAIGIVLLATITGTSNTFDSIPAQLMGIVNSGTQVTFLEGHQLTRKGLGAHSLGAVYAVSGIGGIVGAALLLLVIPVTRPFILSISFGEIAVLALFGILMVALLSHGAMLKGLVAGFFGMLLGTVGTQVNTGIDRFTFGSFDLELGLPLVATILGLMAMPEMLDLVTSRTPVAPSDSDVSTKEVLRGFRAGLRRWKLAVRHSLFGAGIGAVPGTGGAVVSWLSYGMGIALAKDRSEFGKGSLDGLLFAESAENAKESGQALPTLALGVPGSTSWALVLVGMMAYGITPGPNILNDHPDVVGLIIVTFALANLVLTVTALFVTRQLMRLTTIPYPAVGASVLPIIVLGAFLSDPVAITIPVLFLATMVGLLMKAHGWPRPPMVLALVLAPVVEDNFFTAYSVFGFVGFITRPLTIILIVIVIATVVFLHVKLRRTSATVEDVVVPHAKESAAQGAPAAYADPEVGDDGSGPGRSSAVPRWITPGAAVSAGFLAVSLWAGWDAVNYGSLRASLLPIIAASGIAVFALIQLVTQLARPGQKQGQIMDLGLRSAGAAGAKNATVRVALISVAYVAAIYLIGLMYAGLIFAAAIPLALMSGRKRLVVSLVSVALVAAFTWGVAGELFHVFWPESVFDLGSQ